MYALIAAIPILLTVILMVGFNWPAKRALPAFLAYCLFCCRIYLENGNTRNWCSDSLRVF